LVPARKLNGRILLALCIGAVILSLVFVEFAYVVLSPKQTGTMYGTLFINEGGYSNATASATGSYNATLTAENGNGTVLFTFISGTDLLHNHLVPITNYTITVSQISMDIGGHMVVLPWEDNDTVWAHQYDNNYIASMGPLAPGYEVRGQVSASVFGLPANNYVEFRFYAAGGNPNADCC